MNFIWGYISLFQGYFGVISGYFGLFRGIVAPLLDTVATTSAAQPSQKKCRYVCLVIFHGILYLTTSPFNNTDLKHKHIRYFVYIRMRL